MYQVIIEISYRAERLVTPAAVRLRFSDLAAAAHAPDGTAGDILARLRDVSARHGAGITSAAS
jgi:hypothetical protein